MFVCPNDESFCILYKNFEEWLKHIVQRGRIFKNNLGHLMLLDAPMQTLALAGGTVVKWWLPPKCSWKLSSHPLAPVPHTSLLIHLHLSFSASPGGIPSNFQHVFLAPRTPFRSGWAPPASFNPLSPWRHGNDPWPIFSLIRYSLFTRPRTREAEERATAKGDLQALVLDIGSCKRLHVL